jgi:SOS-response transcriptional repressor LexA
MEYGEGVRKYRKEKGLTVAQLAEKLGITQAFMSQIELGQRGVERRPELVVQAEEALELVHGTLSSLLPPTSHARKYSESQQAAKKKHTQPTLVPGPAVVTRLIPYWGAVAAGKPFSFEDAEPTRMIEAFGLPLHGEWIAFTIRGESMDAAGIRDGETVYARIQPSAEHGETVVAWIRDGGYVVKKLVFVPDYDGSLRGNWFLHCRYTDKRKKPKPILVDGDKVRVIGMAKYALREFA